MAFVFWLINRSLPSAIENKNKALKEELNKAQERCLAAEDQLAFAEKELQTFKNNIEKMQFESKQRVQALKEELNFEREQKIESLKNKVAREIENARLNMQNEIEEKIASRALDLAENLLKNNSSLSSFDQNILKSTLNLIEINPQLLKN